MPQITTYIQVPCPRDKKQVDFKTCQACPKYRHFGFRGSVMYVVCGFGAVNEGRIFGEGEEPRDLELEEIEEESSEVE